MDNIHQVRGKGQKSKGYWTYYLLHDARNLRYDIKVSQTHPFRVTCGAVRVNLLLRRILTAGHAHTCSPTGKAYSAKVIWSGKNQLSRFLTPHCLERKDRSPLGEHGS